MPAAKAEHGLVDHELCGDAMPHKAASSPSIARVLAEKGFYKPLSNRRYSRPQPLWVPRCVNLIAFLWLPISRPVDDISPAHIRPIRCGTGIVAFRHLLGHSAALVEHARAHGLHGFRPSKPTLQNPACLTYLDRNRWNTGFADCISGPRTALMILPDQFSQRGNTGRSWIGITRRLLRGAD